MITALQNSDYKWILFNIALVLLGAFTAAAFHTVFARMREYYFSDHCFNLWIPSIIIGLSVIPYHLPFCAAIIHFLIIFGIFNCIAVLLRRITKKDLKFLYCGAIPLILSVVISVYGFLNYLIVIPHEYTIESDKVSEQYMVVFLSDVHGRDPRFLVQKYINDINKLDPDFVILGGDITDEFTSKERMRSIFKAFGSIEAKYGVFYIFGNHDRNKYASLEKYTIDELKTSITENGITILQDNVVEIGENITLIGREDGESEGKERKPMSELMAGVDTRDLIITAEHEPHSYEEVEEQGADLYVCGHTHAGQLFPIGFYFRTFWHTFNTGRHKYNDLDIVITSGFGCWAMPFRTERHCEYMVLKIQPNISIQGSTLPTDCFQ